MSVYSKKVTRNLMTTDRQTNMTTPHPWHHSNAAALQKLKITNATTLLLLVT